MRRTRVALIALLLVAGILPPVAALSYLLTQTLPSGTGVPGGGPPCSLPGEPDDYACWESDSDGVYGVASWISVERNNTGINWSIAYEAWTLNNSAAFTFTNIKTVSLNTQGRAMLRQLVNVTYAGGLPFIVVLASDVHLVNFTLENTPSVSTVLVNGAPNPFYIITTGISVPLSFSQVVLVILFAPPHGGGTPPPELSLGLWTLGVSLLAIAVAVVLIVLGVSAARHPIVRRTFGRKVALSRRVHSRSMGGTRRLRVGRIKGR